MTTIFIVGAGQLGSRHLQALKKVGIPLDITVVDASEASIKLAKMRYFDVPEGECKHQLRFLRAIPFDRVKVDLAIVATNSDVRKQVVEELLARTQIKYVVLEKLLFQKKEDYYLIGDMFATHQIKAWVNCSMRTIPVYSDMRIELGNGPIHYGVSGGNLGLATCAIHYADHLAYLSGCKDFKVETGFLDALVVESKRKNFLELNGVLGLRFADGSYATLSSTRNGSAPVLVEISTPSIRFIVREMEGKTWVSKENKDWKWEERNTPIHYQSEMTTGVVASILKNGTCALVDYETSMQIHIVLLDALQAHVNSHSDIAYNYYPFT